MVEKSAFWCHVSSGVWLSSFWIDTNNINAATESCLCGTMRHSRDKDVGFCQRGHFHIPSLETILPGRPCAQFWWNWSNDMIYVPCACAAMTMSGSVNLCINQLWGTVLIWYMLMLAQHDGMGMGYIHMFTVQCYHLTLHVCFVSDRCHNHWSCEVVQLAFNNKLKEADEMLLLSRLDFRYTFPRMHWYAEPGKMPAS